MKNKLYLECTSGISGDMTVAALLDLGADREKLIKTLESLPVKGFDIRISRIRIMRIMIMIWSIFTGMCMKMKRISILMEIMDITIMNIVG